MGVDVQSRECRDSSVSRVAAAGAGASEGTARGAGAGAVKGVHGVGAMEVGVGLRAGVGAGVSAGAGGGEGGEEAGVSAGAKAGARWEAAVALLQMERAPAATPGALSTALTLAGQSG